MSLAITLDSDKTARYEPSIKRGRSRSWIAIDDIPIRMVASGAYPVVIAFDIAYANQPNDLMVSSLDQENDPEIFLTLEVNSRRIREVRFSREIQLSELAKVADRIELQAQDERLRLSMRFNHEMVAGILRHFRELAEGVVVSSINEPYDGGN